MTTTTFLVSNRPVFLIDGGIDAATVHRVAAGLTALPFTRTEGDDDRTQPHERTLSAEVPWPAVALEPLFSMLQASIERHFPGQALKPHRVYVNCNVPTDVARPHRDCAVDQGDITALYFINEHWDREWGGETIFFDDDGDARLAIAPRPGRVVVFPGAVEHRSGIPSPLCPTKRYALAYKVRPLETQQR